MTVGASGGAYTQIKSGLKSGQEVVIASLSSQIPSSTSGTSTFGGRGGLVAWAVAGSAAWVEVGAAAPSSPVAAAAAWVVER